MNTSTKPKSQCALTEADLNRLVEKIEAKRALFKIGYHILSRLTFPLSRGTLLEIAQTLNVTAYNVSRVVRVVEWLRAYPQLRERFEPGIVSGELRAEEGYRQIRNAALGLMIADARATEAVPPISRATHRRK